MEMKTVIERVYVSVSVREKERGEMKVCVSKIEKMREKGIYFFLPLCTKAETKSREPGDWIGLKDWIEPAGEWFEAVCLKNCFAYLLIWILFLSVCFDFVIIKIN